MIDDAIGELTPITGSVRAACRAAGRPQANHYRRHRQTPAPARSPLPRRTQPRALAPSERDSVRALLNSVDFVDKAPATIYHELLEASTWPRCRPCTGSHGSTARSASDAVRRCTRPGSDPNS